MLYAVAVLVELGMVLFAREGMIFRLETVHNFTRKLILLP